MTVPKAQLAPFTAPPRPATRLASNQAAFASALGRATKTGKPSDAARDAAEQFVAQTLILPLLKQLRASNSAAPPFAPTQAERQFAALQDAETAQRLAHASRFALVDRVARDLLSKSGVDTRELRGNALPDRAAILNAAPGVPRAPTR